MEMTVVFADISSFTEMTGRLGANATYSVVDEFLRLASTTLMSHGAFIDKYIGDAVMAFFNVPIKRADHAAAAVAAATKLQALLPGLSERLGVPLRASIGIASGFARVGRLGSDDIKDYTAIGDAVNQAARLQAQARATEIVVSQDVYQEVASAYPGVPAESFALKGFPQRSVAYRLNGKPEGPLSAAWSQLEDRPAMNWSADDARLTRQRLPRQQSCRRAGASLRRRCGGGASCARKLVRQGPRPRASPYGVDPGCFSRAGLARASTPHAPRLHSPTLLPGDDGSGKAPGSACGRLGSGVLGAHRVRTLDALRDRPSARSPAFHMKSLNFLSRENIGVLEETAVSGGRCV